MSTFTRATCKVCGARFAHESGTEQTCSIVCDRELDSLDSSLECPDCNGLGKVKAGNGWERCITCRGTGDEQNGTCDGGTE